MLRNQKRSSEQFRVTVATQNAFEPSIVTGIRIEKMRVKVLKISQDHFGLEERLEILRGRNC